MSSERDKPVQLLQGTLDMIVATFIVPLLLLAGASLVACYIPARRASSVDPVQALRVE